MKGRLEYPELPPRSVIPKHHEGFYAAVDYVSHRMTKDDQRQHILVLGADPDVDEYQPTVARQAFVNLGGLGYWMVGADGKPFAIAGYVDDELVPGVWKSWMIATDDGWANHHRDLTRGARWAMGQLMSGGARRLETTVLASRTAAQEWYTKFLGMQFEGRRRAYFPNGEDMNLYSFTQEDWVARLGGAEEA